MKRTCHGRLRADFELGDNVLLDFLLGLFSLDLEGVDFHGVVVR